LVANKSSLEINNKMNKFSLMTQSITVLISCILLFSCSTASKTPTERLNTNSATIGFAGDIMMHIAVKNCAARNNIKGPDRKSLNNGGFDYLFERIKPVLSSSDIMLGNMEFPIFPPYDSAGFIFNCRPEIVPALKDAGFTMVTLANNHILDQGLKGFAHTLNVLNEHSLEFIGVGRNQISAREPLIKNVNGIRIGFIAYTGITNYPLPRNPNSLTVNWFFDADKVLEDIRLAKEQSDFLIMTAHTGIEYVRHQPRREIELIKKYAAAGVDLYV